MLLGRIVQYGDDLLINIELDDVDSGKQIWGEQYERKAADLLMVQNDISKEVSQRLPSKLSAVDQQRLMLGATTNPEAYQLYLKGKYFTDKFTKEGFDKGLGYLSQAGTPDPDYALARSEMAYSYINHDDWYINPHVAGPKAREEAKKALAIDESDATADMALAIETQWYEWDWAGAEREFKRALDSIQTPAMPGLITPGSSRR